MMPVVMTILGIVLFFIGILFSIAWHELGHYATARWFGIKVPEFMVGFGKTIWSRKRGETEFGLKAIPLGGYIRMIGMIPPAKGELLGSSRRTGPFQGLIDDVRRQSADEVRPEDADRQFYLRAPWKRIIVMFAGPFMNLVLAVVLFAVVLMGFGAQTFTTTVSSVSECVVPASAQTTECPPGAPPTPAAAAGFRPGDVIVAFNGRPVEHTDWRSLQHLIRDATGTVTITVERDGRRIDLTPTLIQNELISFEDPDETVRASFLGLTPLQETVRQDLPAVFATIGEVVARAGEAIVGLPQRVPDMIGWAFFGQDRGLDSPVGIVGASRIGGEILAQERPVGQEIAIFLNVLAGVNISLFLFNLLPMPPLDGGQIFPAIWEAIRRRIAKLRGKPDPGPVDVAKLMPVTYVVALVILAFGGLMLIADIVNPVRLSG
jgi:membrane-associated protease RseP (regulator of RpoE activity)